MEISKFISGTIGELSADCFNALKKKLLGEYISFSILDENEVKKDVFSEKLCDYFEKLELKTSDDFDKLISEFLSDWNILVEDNISKESSADKDGAASGVPRARKYFVHANRLKESRNITIQQLSDYSRIMMCLYMSIIESQFKEIEDFDYSTKCLEIDKIISAMREKKSDGFLVFGGGAMFDTSELYSLDTGVFIMTIIMYYYVKTDEIEGEY